jgi:hypothetical protein
MFLVVVSFDPMAHPAMLAAFRAQYGLPASVSIYGPYTGKLDNGGESVQLFKPDCSCSPDQSLASSVLVDQLDYADVFPWPIEADGAGSSLQRRRPYQYGNDPVNWKAAAPTPGRANVPGSTYTDADGDGLSDAWESANGFSSANPADASADADGDGRSNYEEFLDGTNPQSAANRLEAPLIGVPPQSQSAMVGSNVVFNVTASGTAPLIYQWRFNRQAIPEENKPALLLSNVDVPNRGSYSVVVWNGAGFSLSQAATLTINVPPSILVQPQTQVVNSNATASFTVVATGTGTVRYQWQFNGVAIVNETNATLTISNAQLGNEGEYGVVVTDDVSFTPSVLVRLIVRVPPSILIPPLGQTNIVGSTMAFSVTCSGSVPMGFQWRQGTVPRTNIVLFTTNCTFTIYNAQVITSGTWRVVITNAGSPNPSTNAMFSVLVVAPPVITNQPASQNVSPGNNATFTVGVRGSAPFGFRWYFQNNPLPDATNATLSLTNVQATHEGAYHVVVTNFAGSATSAVATLTLVRPLILSDPEVLANGHVRMKISGPLNQSYQIEISGNLTQWSVLSTLAYTNGLMPFTDATAVGVTNRFYRVRRAP